MARLIKKVVRCRHDHSGVPALYGDHERPPAAFAIGARVICLDCGEELPRNWEQVRVSQQQLTRYEALAGLAGGIAEA